MSWFRELNKDAGASDDSLAGVTVDAEPNHDMLLQFRGSLQATLVGTDVTDAPLETQALYNEAKQVLDASSIAFTWNDAYQVEKLLAYLRPYGGLRYELQCHTKALSDAGHSRASIYEEELKAVPDDPPPSERYAWDDPRVQKLRHLLERVLNDYHWQSSQRIHGRKITEKYTIRIFVFNLVLCTLFLGGLLVVPRLSWTALSFSGIDLALLTGLLGASFSILTGRNQLIDRNHTSIEELLRLTSRSMVLLRLGVGGVAALILYFFLESELVSGMLFPELTSLGFAEVGFSKLAGVEPTGVLAEISQTSQQGQIALESMHGKLSESSEQVAVQDDFGHAKASFVAISNRIETGGRSALGISVPNSELSKLLVWSFLAGFSEKLVPKMMGQVTTQEQGST